MYVFITGTCMYLNGGNSVLNGYNCCKFRHGCPNSSYFSDEVYKCNLLKIYDLAMVLFWNILPLIRTDFLEYLWLTNNIYTCTCTILQVSHRQWVDNVCWTDVYFLKIGRLYYINISKLVQLYIFFHKYGTMAVFERLNDCLHMFFF